MVYKWETPIYTVDANIVGREVQKLEKEKGSFTRQDMVDRARKKSNPMHDLFEWDDTVAAEKYRCTQAGIILSNLKVVVEGDGQQVSRAWVNVQKVAPNCTARYVNVEVAMKNEETKTTVFENALKELENFKRKYESLHEFEALFEEIDKLIEQNG